MTRPRYESHNGVHSPAPANGNDDSCTTKRPLNNDANHGRHLVGSTRKRCFFGRGVFLLWGTFFGGSENQKQFPKTKYRLPQPTESCGFTGTQKGAKSQKETRHLGVRNHIWRHTDAWGGVFCRVFLLVSFETAKRGRDTHHSAR